jgi:peptidylprolyl isomerase
MYMKYAKVAGLLAAVVALLLVTGCVGTDPVTPAEAGAKSGDTVRVHYIGMLADGSEFNNSTGGEPYMFTIGTDTVISGFEQAVIGLTPGETRMVTVPADEAYGPHDENRTIKINRTEFPDELAVVGQYLTLPLADGNMINVVVSNVTETDVTLDANHYLAGKDLTFKITLIEIM